MRTPRQTKELIAFYLLTLGALLAYTRGFFFSGWIPHDEGLLGQSAERALSGQIPHRDFDEMYSGGLTYIHALVFRCLGVGVGQLREFHWLIAGLFTGLSLLLGMRLFGSRWKALGLAAVVTTWGPINYPASMPSWYVVYLAAAAGALLGSGEEDEPSTAFSFLSGVVAGLAVWIKITGLFIVLGLGQLLLARAVSRSSKLLRWLPLLVSGFCLIVTGHSASKETLIWLCAPILALGFYYVGLPSQRPRPDDWRQVVAFSVGAILSVSGFFWVGTQAAGWEPLWRGLWVLPKMRVSSAAMPLPAVGLYLLPVPLAILALSGLISVARRAEKRASSLGVGLLTLLALVLLGAWGVGYQSIWLVLRCIPILLAALLFIPSERPLYLQEQVWLALSVWLGLTQFPYAHGIYLVYCMPLCWLALTAWSRTAPRHLSRTIWAAVIALGAFAAFWVNTGDWRRFGVMFSARSRGIDLPDPRIGIRLPADEARLFHAFLARVHANLPPGEPILAFPDAPEVPFLVGHPSVTRSFYEVLGSDPGSGPQGDTRYFDLSRRSLVVINTEPEFSRPLSADELAELARRFPHASRFGRYLVMTREPQR